MMTALERTEEMISAAMAKADAEAGPPGDQRCYAFPYLFEDAEKTCIAKGPCKVGWVVRAGGRESWNGWLEVSTSLVTLCRSAAELPRAAPAGGVADGSRQRLTTPLPGADRGTFLITHNGPAPQRRTALDAPRHGTAHMRTIGTAGAAVTINRHGVGYRRGLVQAKGRRGRRPVSLTVDLAAGRVDALLAT